mmetsp:Transcript_74743/g.178353  ORF Transcript_74743/g.178353 Transcript_74743/m.178353 type:complete len:271 (+) Transcript_74743:1499-2311(+)
MVYCLPEPLQAITCDVWHNFLQHCLRRVLAHAGASLAYVTGPEISQKPCNIAVVEAAWSVVLIIFFDLLPFLLSLSCVPLDRLPGTPRALTASGFQKASARWSLQVKQPRISSVEPRGATPLQRLWVILRRLGIQMEGPGDLAHAPLRLLRILVELHESLGDGSLTVTAVWKKIEVWVQAAAGSRFIDDLLVKRGHVAPGHLLRIVADGHVVLEEDVTADGLHSPTSFVGKLLRSIVDLRLEDAFLARAKDVVGVAVRKVSVHSRVPLST